MWNKSSSKSVEGSTQLELVKCPRYCAASVAYKQIITARISQKQSKAEIVTYCDTGRKLKMLHTSSDKLSAASNSLWVVKVH